MQSNLSKHEADRIERLVYVDPKSRIKLTTEVLERESYDPEYAEEVILTIKMNYVNNSLNIQMNRDEANTFFSDLIKALVKHDFISVQDLNKITQDEYL